MPVVMFLSGIAMLRHLPQLFSFVLILFVIVSANADRFPVLKSPAGAFKGKFLTSDSGSEFAAFRGIPYALPPVGERRFAKPMPFPTIEEEFDATKFGPICLQADSEKDRGQEDCLYLNVYTPVTEQGTIDVANKLKVFVFVHGGGFVIGSGNYYVPGDFVTEGNVIVVTINYRLGWPGFLRGDSDLLPGNQALWDQLLALRWVKDNIQAFGGDPDDVTLAGESAGSISVTALSISPLGKGLFTKAVLLSGVAFSFPTPSRTSNDLVKAAAGETGCTDTVRTDNIQELISCLHAQPQDKMAMKFSLPRLISLLSSGDEILPKPVFELLKDSGYLSKVGFYDRDYIVSATKDDAFIRIHSKFGFVNTSTVETTIPYIAKLLHLPDSVVNPMLMEYMNLNRDVERAAVSLLTDATYIKRNLHFMDIFNSRSPAATTGTGKGSAYLISFDHSPKCMLKSYMPHMFELSYLFDSPLAKSIYEDVYGLGDFGSFDEDDQKMKSAFIGFIVDFMNTG